MTERALSTDAPTPPRTDRQVEILQVARAVLADEGYARFSMRSVAAAAGMHLKTLQYHFRTKRALIDAVVEYAFETYDLETFTELFEARHAETPRKRLSEVIDWILRDVRNNPSTSRYYFEIYAMAMRDPATAEVMDRIYDLYRRRFATLVREINPTLPEDVAYRRGALMAAITEGAQVYIAHGKPLHDDLDALIEEFKARVLDIALAP